jgi:hypothetical protein
MTATSDETEAVLRVLRKAYRDGTPWATRSQIAAAAGLSPVQTYRALCELASRGEARRGLFDDGRALVVHWKGEYVQRTRSEVA